MDILKQIEELSKARSEDTHDLRENTYANELKDKQKLLEYEIMEEHRRLNSLPGTPPQTFRLGSHVRVKYLSGVIEEFVATIVPENEIPFFEFEDDFEQKKEAYQKRRENSSKGLYDIEGTPLSVHSPLASTVYGKVNGVYRVVVDEEVHEVEVEFC